MNERYTPVEEAPGMSPDARARPAIRGLRRIDGAVLAILIVGTLWFARSLLVPIALALLVWLTFARPVRWSARRGVPAAIPSALIVILLAAAGAGALYLASGPIAPWITDFAAVAAELRVKLHELIEPVNAVIDASKAIEEGASPAGEEKVVVQGPGLLSTVASNLQYLVTTTAITLVLLFFLLASGDHFHARLVESFDHFGDKKRALGLLLDVERDVSLYLFTIATINAALGFTVALALWFAGMENAASWGVTAAILNFIPYAGALIGIVMVGVAAVLTFDALPQMLIPPAAYMALTVLEGQFITPALLGRRFRMNPVLILVSVAFWAWIWGLVGALIAVPVLVIAKVVCERTGIAPWFVRFGSTEQERSG